MGANEVGSSRLKFRMSTKWMVAMVMVLMTGSISKAQLPTATILGEVKDVSGAVISGANVTARNTETGQTRTAMTSDDGAYRFPGLPVGNYEVRAEHAGFRTEVRSGLLLVVGQEAVIDVVLQVGAAEQTVSVTAEAPLVNTTTSSLGGLVGEKQIEDLPLNGRNYIDLSLLQTGVQQRADLATGSLSNSGTQFSSNGAPVRSNGYLLDGAPLVNMYGTNSGSVVGGTLGVDGIREYKVVTNSFSAEYGGAMGSQMTIVSKSGSNKFTGTVFEYLRNSAMDATDHFYAPTAANPRRIPEFQRNNFGGAFGGPIKHDKSFIFANYEGLRSTRGITTASSSSTLNIPGCVGPVGTTLWNNVGTQPAGSQLCPLLPSTIATDTPGSGFRAGLGNTVNSVKIGALTQPWLAIWPKPNSGTSQVILSDPETVGENYGQARFDQNISSKDNMFARWTVDDAYKTTPGGAPGGGTGFPPFNANYLSRSQFITLAEDHIFTPILLNSARVSFSRTVLGIQSPDPYIGPQFSLNTGWPIGNITISAPSGATPILSFGPFRNSPALVKQNVYAYSDDVFYTHNKHAVKFGVLVDHYLMNPNSNSNPYGTAGFANLADFYDGITNSTSSTTPGAVVDRTATFNLLGFYIQDDFRVTPRLTLNLGFRYEFATDLSIQQGRSSNIRNVRTDTAAGTLGPLFLNPTKKDFSPRLGFAWDVMGDGKTAVRGGFGLLYDTASWWGTMMIVTDNNIPPFGSTSTGGSTTSLMTLPLAYPAKGTSASIPNYNMKQPQILQYNLAVERQLPWTMSLNVAFVGSHGYHLPIYEEGNPQQVGLPNPLGGQTVGGVVQDNCMMVPAGQSVNYSNPLSYCFLPNANPPNLNWNPANPNSGKLNQNLGTIVYIDPVSNSWYNGLQVNLNKRFSKGLSFQVAYTYSRSEDETNGPSGADGSGTPMNSYSIAMDKARSAWDAAQNLRFNATYRLPQLTSNPYLGKVANGWAASAILSKQTGYPFSPSEGTTDRSREQTMGTTGTNRPNVNAGRSNDNITHGMSTGCMGYPAATTVLGTVQTWFDPCAYSVQNTGFLGNASRNSLLGPGLTNLDFSITKDTKIAKLGESTNLQFRIETFNLFNHPNYPNPSGTIFAIPSTANNPGPSQNNLMLAPSANIGKITTTRTSMRQIQLALRLSF